MKMHHIQRTDRDGIILVIVLVVIAMLALSAYTFTDLMISHNQAANSYVSLAQSRGLIKSGVSTMQGFLLQPKTAQVALGGTYNNPGLFYQQIVVPDANLSLQGMFSIVAAEFDTNGNPIGLRYGLQNESAKLNLNELLTFFSAPLDQQTALMNLPGMTVEIADSIIDWLDANTTPEPYGAEAEYYSALTPPYQPKDGPLDSLSELLMVRGVTADLLYGRDKNRNGQIDAAELAAQLQAEVNPALGSLDLGWQAFLTVVSAEGALNPEGEAKIDVNGATDLQELHDSLSAVVDVDWASFICACRIVAPTPAVPGATSISGMTVNLTATPGNTIGNFLDLVDASVRVTGSGVALSPFTSDPSSVRDDLMKLMDYVTLSANPKTPGKINPNLARRPVLAAVVGTVSALAPTVVDTILNAQQADADPVSSDRRHFVWLLSEGIVTRANLLTMEPLLTGGGDVYSANIVGFFADGRHVARANVIIDGTFEPGKQYLPILQWEELTPLGRGYLRSELSGQVEAGAAAPGAIQ